MRLSPGVAFAHFQHSLTGHNHFESNLILAVTVSNAMIIHMRKLLLLLSVILSASQAFAGLEWESTTFSRVAEPTDEQTEAVFRFTNTGTEPVQIDEVSSSCGCTAAKPSKEIYQPGEGGEITAVFSHGFRIGQQHKTVTVVTTEGTAKKSYNLELEVSIPELVRSGEPRLLSWKLNEPAEPKAVQVIVDPKFPIEVQAAQVRGPQGRFEVIGTKKVSETVWEVWVKPVDTETPKSGSLSVLTNFPENNPRRVHFLMRVK